MSGGFSQSALAILAKLEDGQFHSGEQLGNAIGIGRAAVNKQIKQLRDAGVCIHAVTGKGYQLAKHQQLLIPEQLKLGLPNNPLHYFIQLDSTNQYLMDRLGQISPGTLCIAETQTAGRGRRGRQWQSPLASQIICSLYWPLAGGMKAASGLSIVVGIALAEALQLSGLAGVQLKWPNDLLFQGAKLGGILIEMNGQAEGVCHLVIGFGINVAMTSPKMKQVEQPWCDLSHIAANQPGERRLNRTELTLALINALNHHLSQFEQHGMAPYQQQWLQWDAYHGKRVKLLSGQRQIMGLCRGVDETGAILLETENGTQPFNGGEISLRPE